MSTGVIISRPVEYCTYVYFSAYRFQLLHVAAYIFISAWALALSVLQYRAMRRPQRVGQTAGGSHAFLFMSKRQ